MMNQTIEMSYLPFEGGLANGYRWIFSNLTRIRIVLHLGGEKWSDEMLYVRGEDNKFYYFTPTAPTTPATTRQQ